MTDDDKPYEVGFGKPPKTTQFKPGQSGNPKGRTKGVKNFNTYLREAGSQKVRVTKNGAPRNVPLIEVSAMQIAQKAAKGDLKAAMTLAGAFPDETSTTAGGVEGLQWDSAADHEVLQSMLARIRGQTTGANVEAEAPQSSAEAE